MICDHGRMYRVEYLNDHQEDRVLLAAFCVDCNELVRTELVR